MFLCFYRTSDKFELYFRQVAKATMEQFILGRYARNYKKINSKNDKKYHRAEALGLVTICVVHPCSYAHASALLESEAEGAVAAVAAFACQQLGYDGVSGCKYLVVAADEVVDAQVVDIGVVGNALTGEILAEIRAVGTNHLGQLQEGKVVLQVKLSGDAVLM